MFKLIWNPDYSKNNNRSIWSLKITNNTVIRSNISLVDFVFRREPSSNLIRTGFWLDSKRIIFKFFLNFLQI